MKSPKTSDRIDERAQHLLRALVARYISDGMPVGSQTLLRDSGLDLSPATIRNIMADKASGMTAAYAVMAALFQRERTGGRGQRIDVPMLDAFAAFVLPDALGAETFPPAEGAFMPVKPADLYRCWKTADGFVAIVIIEDHQFQAICKAVDREMTLTAIRLVEKRGGKSGTFLRRDER